MNDWIAAILLGIIEGLTEFLPISSTGHLLIAQNWFSAFKNWSPAENELFTVVIQPGAVLAVIAVFYGRLRQMASTWRDPKTLDYLLKLGVAFVITGAGGLAVKKLGFTLPKDIAPIAWATFIGGILILMIEYVCRGKQLPGEVTWLVAFTVAAAQILAAVCPGTSRSGASILFAMLVGLSRPAATEFSFLVGIPTMLAAGAYEVYKALKEVAPAHSEVSSALNVTAQTHAHLWGVLLVGTVVSAITAFLVVKWLLRFVQSHTFNGFGWYRIALGGALLALVARNVIR